MSGGRVLQEASFRTGGSWIVHDDFVIHMALGDWQSEDDGLEEAEFMRERFEAVKRLLPTGRLLVAIVDLSGISRWETAHLSTLQIYANMTKDPLTRKVAIVHATNMQKVLIVPLIKLVVHNKKKLQFFNDLAAATEWVLAPADPAS